MKVYKIIAYFYLVFGLFFIYQAYAAYTNDEDYLINLLLAAAAIFMFIFRLRSIKLFLQNKVCMITFGFIFYRICVLICSWLKISYSNANKIYLNLQSKKNEDNYHYLKTVTEQPRLFIGSLKVGNSIFITVLSLLFFTTFL